MPPDVIDLQSIFPCGIIGIEQTYEGLTDEENESLRALLQHEVSEKTRGNYLPQWRRLQDWAERRDVESRPADPMQIAAYLLDRLGEGHMPSTPRVSVSGISSMHRNRHLPGEEDAGCRDTYGKEEAEAGRTTH